MAAAYSPETRENAKRLYIQRFSPKEIAEKLELGSVRVVYNWAKKEQWDNLLVHETLEDALARRIALLVDKLSKTPEDYKEFEFLTDQLLKNKNIQLKQAQIDKEHAITTQIENGKIGVPSSVQQDLDGNGPKQRREKRKKKKTVKNDISEITEEQLQDIRDEIFFDYQKRWFDNRHHRSRFILKSRQIGATYYFSWEAFEKALTSGNNQIFVSASRKQAELFKGYICAFAKQYFDVTLSGGEAIELSNGVQLVFLSTNARTAQGYSGDLYFDEVFWTPNFMEFHKVVTAVSSQKKYTKTYFSTPSVESHGAFTLWSGERWQNARKGREGARRAKLAFDLSHKTLVDGVEGHDGIWRNIVTIKDAEQQGCDLFDIEDLRDEYTDAEFKQLFMCEFMRDGDSAFKLDDLLNCAIADIDEWLDLDLKAPQPLGNTPVWLGYDPARKGDNSVVVAIPPPLTAAKPYRVVEKINLKGSWEHQSARVQELFERYKVDYLGVDCTGPGHGVSEKLKDSANGRYVHPIHYTLETKTELVLRAQGLIESGLLKWSAEHTDIIQGFLQIRQEATSGDKITYVSDRNKRAGHADAAWAIMNGLANRPLTGKKKQSFYGIH